MKPFYDAKTSELVCSACNTKESVKLPLSLDTFCETIRRFARLHRKCA